ncbi:condensin-2 complex subunit H2-like [Tubulanus polymorphus]|uniref:condensin-2 complex subunit H2-like n=1 Tax=Tubulanus polymorphus TaxID=672921 RepID=UPI003DA6BDE2
MGETAAAGGDAAGHLAQLMHPIIRDLNENWNVQIAEQLDDYLQQVGQIQISFDGGKTTVNFAEAAMLIQGSACVYSKKVEYLYSYVCKVLEMVTATQKNNRKKAGATAGGGDDGDDVADDADDGEEQFLTLDDVAPKNNIDLRDGTLGILKDLTRTPMVLVKIDAIDKSDNPLISRKGELIGSRLDFRMNTSEILRIGSLILDLSHLSLLKESSSATQLTTAISAPSTGDVMRNDEVCEVRSDDVGDDRYDDDDGGGDFDEIPDPAAAAEVSVNEAPHQELPDANQQHMQLRRKRVQFTSNLEDATASKSKKTDFWQLLDPHQTTVEKEKPPKKVKLVIPAALKTNKKSDRNVKPTKDVPLCQFLSKAYSHRSKFTSNALKVPSYAGFERLYWTEYKRRQQISKQLKTLIRNNYGANAVDVYEQEEEEPRFTEPEYLDAADDDDGDDDNVVDFDDVGAAVDIHDDPLAVNAARIDDDLFSQQSDLLCSQSYEELVRKYVDEFLTSAQKFAELTELSKRVGEWEDKVVPKLEEEETRPAFDIHSYGSAVLESFPTKSRSVSFNDIAKTQTPHEVCRLFAATLQLANNYNLQISTDENSSESGMDSVSLKLLSLKRHHEELEGYRVPSHDDI